jgi:hypothetical protein
LLLVACSTLPAVEKNVRFHALIQGAIRWNEILRLAEEHGVANLLYQELSAVHDVIPSDAMLGLKQSFETNLLKVMLTARELMRILDCLDSLGIEVMPYKGLALAEMLYGDVAARQAGDIDLLIHARDLARIKDAVRELGYTTHLELSVHEEQAYLASGYECAFDGASGTNLLEVQWALQPRFYAVDFDLEESFPRSIPVKVAGREMKTPSPEDLVLILSVHAAKHLWTKLIWLCDFTRLMRMPGIKWISIQDRAIDLGIVRILRVTLLLAQHLLEAELPSDIRHETVNDRKAEAWARLIREQIVSRTSFDVESWQYFRAAMGLRERRRDRMRFLWRLAVTPGPSEWKSVRLPAPLFPLYRMVRLSRLAARLAGL